jgi:hypothetical protein
MPLDVSFTADGGVDFIRVVDTIAGNLEGQGFSCAVVGALALHAYGITRLTVDLDLATEAGAQAGLVRHLEGLGYETLHRSAGYSNHLHGDAAWGRVDLVYVDPSTAARLFSSETRLPVGQRLLPVPSPEHLIAMKVQAIKNDPRRTLKDLGDIQALLRLPGLDEAAVRRYFEKAGLLERYHELKHLL